MKYLVKTPGIVQRWIYPAYTWQLPAEGKKLYLTFDDGPHPSITPFVLDELKKYNAKATFFCIGKNVEKHPEIYKRMIMEGHTAGNHTYDHVNGWHTADRVYFNSIERAARFIDSRLFRPPYGRITRFQAAQLQKQLDYKVIMWTVLSGDFDPDITPEQCLKNVLKNSASGSIIVFHDSEKANEKLKFALPEVLKQLTNEGFVFEKLAADSC
ncbi:MAG: polysaccharide deacetylase family protein [Chitinophagaceae bacterium]|nr:polysaccharide deacetylase family protein [Chitinophagaceae bacterium]